MKAFIAKLFNSCMTVDRYNSRLMFFIHGITCAFGTLVLTIAFIFASKKDGYDYMIAALGGSGGIAAAGRFLTNRKTEPDATPAPVGDDAKPS